MYEELRDQLRYCCCATTCEGCPFGFEGCQEDLMKDAADAIECLNSQIANEYIVHKAIHRNLSARIPRWIPTAERLPDEYVSVLCYCSRNGQYGCGERCKEDNGTIYWIGLNGMIPTHWMPLPEPPKEE